MEIADIITRLDTEVTEFRSVETVAKLSSLVEKGGLPNATPAAFVVPLGFSAGPQQSATGIHQQQVTDTFGVIIVTRAAGDGRGEKAVIEIENLNPKVITALTGWSLEGDPNVMQLVRGELLSANAGAVIYQLNFNQVYNLRINQ